MSVTDAESRASTTFNSGNAVVELIKNRTNKRLFRQLAAPAVEEAKRLSHKQVRSSGTRSRWER